MHGLKRTHAHEWCQHERTRAGHARVMTTLRDRLEQAIAFLEQEGRSMRAWGIEAGFSGGYVRGLRDKLAASEDGEGGSKQGVEALSRKLSEYSRGLFPPLWLLTGEGEAPEPTRDRYPSRARVMRMALAAGHPSWVVDELARMPLYAEEDPGDEFWEGELEKLVHRADRLVKLREDASVFDTRDNES